MSEEEFLAYTAREDNKKRKVLSVSYTWKKVDEKVHWEIEKYYWKCIKEKLFHKEIGASE